MAALADLEQDLRAALAHLYDPLYQPSVLLREVTGCQARDAAGVRAVLTQAIHSLEPPLSVPRDTPVWRLYWVLHDRYVLRLTQAEVAARLCIGDRYLREEQGKAIHLLARVLADGFHPPDGLQMAEHAEPGPSTLPGVPPAEAPDTPRAAEAPAQWLSQVQQELAALRRGGLTPTSDVKEILRDAADTGRAIAVARGVALETALPPGNPCAAIHPTILRQIVLEAIRELSRCAPAGRVVVQVRADEGAGNMPARPASVGAYSSTPVQAASAGAEGNAPARPASAGAYSSTPVQAASVGAEGNAPARPASAGAYSSTPVQAASVGAEDNAPARPASAGAYSSTPVQAAGAGAEGNAPARPASAGAYSSTPVQAASVGAEDNAAARPANVGAYSNTPVQAASVGAEDNAAARPASVGAYSNTPVQAAGAGAEDNAAARPASVGAYSSTPVQAAGAGAEDNAAARPAGGGAYSNTPVRAASAGAYGNAAIQPAAASLTLLLEATPARADRELDLSLVHELVATAQGRVDTARVGATLSLALTFARVSAQERKRTVFVVEDNEDLVGLYRSYAAKTRYEIVHISEAQAIFGAVELHTPDAIVLDLMLPDTDGWKLLTVMHAHPLTRAIPVVVCSVVRDEELALALGAAGYLAKPVRRQEFIGALDRALSPAASGSLTEPARTPTVW